MRPGDMANHISHAALPYPVKNAKYTVGVEFIDADGDPTDPTTPDTEVSIDGAAFADSAEEVSVITGSNGGAYITLTAAETNCSLLMICSKSASGGKSQLMTLYPRVLPVIYSGTAAAGAAGSITLASSVPDVADLLIGAIVKTTGGTGGGGSNNQARVITDFTTARVASVVPNWEVNPDNTTTYEILLTEACVLRYSNLLLVNGVKAPVTNLEDFFDGSGFGVHPARWTVVSVPGTNNIELSGPNASMGADVIVGATLIIRDNGAPTNFFYAYVTDFDESVPTLSYMPVSTPGFSVGAGDIVEVLPPGFTQTDRRLTQYLSGFAQAGTSTTIKFPLTASTSNDAYNGYRVDIVDGPGAGQTGYVQDYDGPTRVATMNRAWLTTPTSASYMVVRGPRIQFVGENVSAHFAAGTVSATLEPSATEAIGVQVEAEIDDRLLTADSTSRLERSSKGITKGTVTSFATTTTIPTSSLDPAATQTDQFKNGVLVFDSNTLTAALRGQRTEITASTAGGILGVSPALQNAPANGDTFTII